MIKKYGVGISTSPKMYFVDSNILLAMCQLYYKGKCDTEGITDDLIEFILEARQDGMLNEFAITEICYDYNTNLLNCEQMQKIMIAYDNLVMNMSEMELRNYAGTTFIEAKRNGKRLFVYKTIFDSKLPDFFFSEANEMKILFYQVYLYLLKIYSLYNNHTIEPMDKVKELYRFMTEEIDLFLGYEFYMGVMLFIGVNQEKNIAKGIFKPRQSPDLHHIINCAIDVFQYRMVCFFSDFSAKAGIPVNAFFVTLDASLQEYIEHNVAYNTVISQNMIMPSAGQRQISEDIPVSEWENPYITIPAPEEVAVAIADRYISIQTCSDGYDYTIYDDEYKELDGGVYDNPDISIYTALNEIITDLRESAENAHTYLQGEVKADSKVLPVNYDKLSERVEIVAQKAIAEEKAKQAATQQSVIADFRAKTEELFHDIKGQTPEDIEQTVYAYVRAKIEEYDTQASIVDVVVAGSRCRGMEAEDADLDVIVEFSGKEREDNLFNLLHEDGLKIGGVLVDINPITEDKTGTLATYLPLVDAYLSEKAEQMTARAEKEANEPQKTVTLTVAECSEFHNMGEFHEGIGSVDEAMAIYDSIPPERLHGIRGIGVNIHTEGTEEYMDVQMDILSGKLMDLDMLNHRCISRV